MGKRFLILISAAALGAALMAAGASADFRSVHDPRGDTTCGHEHGAHGPCSDRKKRNADIVRATAGHDGIWLKHTIRVVGKFQAAELVISPDSDPPLCVGALRGVPAWSRYISECGSDVVTGHARMDFHHHSVEIFFSEGSIGRPQSYGWSVYTWAGDSKTFANDQVPNVQGRQIRHRLAQPAAALLDSVPPNLQLSGPKRQDPQNDPLHHNCDNGYCDVAVKVRCGHQTCTARSWGKLTNVRNDNLTPDGSWDVIQPGHFRPFGRELTLSQCRQVRRALHRGEKVKAKFTVRARDAAGNVATAKRTIRLVKNTPG